MTFRKTVLAYIVGWLIVMPLYNRVFNAWKRREMAKPDGEYRTHLREMSAAIVDEMEDRSPIYPYKNGDEIVLGPECFISSDGRVICYQGENYYPHRL